MWYGTQIHQVQGFGDIEACDFKEKSLEACFGAFWKMGNDEGAAIHDTRCGFKLFSRPSLPYIIPYMHNEGWIFDVEMLMLAEFAGIPVVEVPIGWREVLGSKLNVIWDSLGMAYGLALLRLCGGLGIYRHD